MYVKWTGTEVSSDRPRNRKSSQRLGGEGSPLTEAKLAFSQTVFPRSILGHGSFPSAPHPHVCVCASAHAHTNAVHNGTTLSCSAWGSALSDRSRTIWNHGPGRGRGPHGAITPKTPSSCRPYKLASIPNGVWCQSFDCLSFSAKLKHVTQWLLFHQDRNNEQLQYDSSAQSRRNAIGNTCKEIGFVRSPTGKGMSNTRVSAKDDETTTCFGNREVKVKQTWQFIETTSKS